MLEVESANHSVAVEISLSGP